jgi:hypothetical protein
MLRLVKSVEKRPEEATVINWTVPVYIKYGEDYYKVCFDIKRKPLSDNSLPLTKEELEELTYMISIGMETVVLVEYVPNQFVWVTYSSGREESLSDVKAILWLAERFELTEVK